MLNLSNQLKVKQENMFESSKNDLARKVLFGERIKTIFFYQ